MRLVLLIALLLLTSAARGQSEMTAKDFIDQYKQASEKNREEMRAVLVAELDGMFWMNAFLRNKYNKQIGWAYCNPHGDEPLGGEELFSIIQRRIQEYPDQETGPFPLVMLLGLLGAYPCKEN